MSCRARRIAAAGLLLGVAVSPFTRVAAQRQLAPARANLRAVPLPPLDGLDAPVQDQLLSAPRGVEQVAARQAGSGELASAYGTLAQLFHAYELFDGAEPAYVNASRLAPSDGRWPHLLGYLYQHTGRLPEAAEKLATAQRLQPGRREASARLAEVYLGLNRLRESRELFVALLDVFPAFAHNGLGELALRERRFDEAASHFRSALQRMPQANALHYSLGMAYRGLGRLDDARAELERRGSRAIRLGDPIVDALALLVRGERLLVIRGTRAFDAGEFGEAAGWFEKAIADSPASAVAHLNLGLTFVQLAEYARATEHLEAALRLGHADDEPIVNVAIVLSDRGRYGEAVALLDKAHARSPASVPTATTLARLLAAAPDPAVRNSARALELAMKVYEADSAPVHAETVALALMALRRCGEALDWMRRAIAAAEQVSAADASRLKGELPKYETCGR